MKMMKEITEGFSEGKVKMVQLNWTPQPQAPCNQTVFIAHKCVKSYDLCKKHNLLVSGGMDRLIRLWNPNVPGRRLSGHVTLSHSEPVLCCGYSEELRQ
ncbi:hypothetical protein NHX12_009442, partial [Muraenolepis orangiensis]